MANQHIRIYTLEATLLFLACLSLHELRTPVFAQERSTDAVERAFASATRLHEAGDILGAISGYQAILVNHPERIDVRSNLGAAYSRLGRYEDAIEQYKLALIRDNRNLRIRRNLGLAYYKAAMFTEAADELSRFIAEATQGPERKDAVLVFADCQVRLGE